MNKTISLHYGEDLVEFNLPEEKIVWTASPKQVKPISDVSNEIEKAIDNPIDCMTISQLVDKYGKNTVIIIDDFTRVTPVNLILPVLVDKLNKAGVRDEQITILVALGTHREMSPEECRQKVGEAIFNRIKVINHKWYDEDSLVYVGETPSGVPIKVNKIYYESDISIAIGNVIPHIYAGWSAGAKLIQPGVSGTDTTAKTHLIAATHLKDILGNPDNLVRLEMEEIARKTGLKMIINTVLNPDGSLAAVFAGDIVKAHRACVEVAEKIYAVDIKDRPDAVICSSYPAYYDLWQSCKPMTVAASMVKDKGTVILLTPAPEGDCPGHPEFVGLGVRTVDELNEMIKKGMIEDEVSASVNMTVSVVREMAKIIVVTEEFNKKHIETLGLTYASDIEEALTIADLDSVNTIGIITHGADLARKY